MLIKEKLRNLRAASGHTQREVADGVRIDRVSYTRYELGTRIPTNDAIVSLATFFDCTTDYLLGKTDNPNAVHYDLGEVEGMELAIDIVKDAIKDGLTPEEIQRVVQMAKDLKNSAR